MSRMGRLRRVERAGGHHDVRLRLTRSARDDVQLAGGRVVLRERGEGATSAGKIHRTQCVERRAQLEGGRVIAEREHRPVEGDDAVDGHVLAGVPTAIRRGPTWTHLDRVDDAEPLDPDQPAGQPRGNTTSHVDVDVDVDVDVVRGRKRRAGRGGHDRIVCLRRLEPHRAQPLRS